MMYNWPPNTRAQQTLSGWCNSTLPFTYRPSRSSLFLLYGYGSCPSDSSPGFPSVLSDSSEIFWAKVSCMAPFVFLIVNIYVCFKMKCDGYHFFNLGFYIKTNIRSQKDTIFGQICGINANKIQSCYYIIALYRARCVELCWWEF